MVKLNPKSIIVFFVRDITAGKYHGIKSFFSAVFWTAFFIGCIIGATFIVAKEFLLAALAFLVFLAVTALFFLAAYLEFRNFDYFFEQDNVVIKKGVIRKTTVTIPYSKVQNINIKRGLLLRILGLSEVQIETAGATAATGKIKPEGLIPAVGEEDAKKIFEFLNKKIEVLK